ncbi:MAG: LysE/ArgO family amino acid transporter [Propionibacteriaceae bacterium]|nr:LysE/ArgO family amino acid transporter [Propionibacteriaceae bacterium]
MIPAVFAGLAAGLSLIVAIGAQNAFVLRQGLRLQHVGGVVAICAISDIILITVGVSGLQVVAGLAPWVLSLITWAGVAFLIAYGALSLRRAIKGGSQLEAGERGVDSAWTTLVTAIALTWLNPHVYLDTVLLLGSLAVGHQPLQWWFAIGAMVASCLWFSALGFGARWLRPIFASPKAWRILDFAIAAIMWAIAGSLAFSQLSG